ncbi:2OG-Fe(II) oxygenase [Ralstonia soli]|uniref:2OG-Fe(II) oxygenase n=1 Tax=Ralstonia soli TaxID=2953896 RepID=A0ABT1ANY2_9RALS|nr:2OG-Fe(II) oxygenase [Ralstonia soli]MCO5400147.1 2OG-Fe(II) oxygenase [Ralstonia soli]
MTTTQPYATMSDALRDWLQRHVTEGFEADSLVASMVQSGYDRAFARRVVDEALAARAPAPAVAPVPAPAADEPVENSNAVRTADGEIPILFAIETPRIVLFQHFLSDDECDQLIAIGRSRLKRSPVVNPETGEENLISARTSQGAMFQVGEHPLIARIEARIAQAVGVPVEHGEGFQVLNYQPGGEYQPHFDFFNPGRTGEARQLEVGGQRVATMVIYLNSVQAGGATGFPKLGLEVAPVKGNAVFFVYKRPDGTLDEATLHAGLPVERGEKWIATKWLRERPYRRGA